MKKLILFSLLVFVLAGCASQTAQIDTGKAFIAMHDSGESVGEALNALCVQKIIPPDPCLNTIKPAYDKFRLAWPVLDDALMVYLNADPNDLVSLATFQEAQKVFNADFAAIMDLGVQFGIFKQEVK